MKIRKIKSGLYALVATLLLGSGIVLAVTLNDPLLSDHPFLKALYEKFQTVWDSVKYDETEGGEEEFSFDIPQEEYEFESKWPFDNMNSTSENKGSTITITSNEEDEAFKDLEKAIRNWKHTAP